MSFRLPITAGFRLPRWSLHVLATALAYAALGWLALQLPLPTHYATPLFPAAGLALAAVLVIGKRAAWGVAAGSFAMYAVLAGPQAPPALLFAVPLALAAGAALQALVAARLVHRYVRQPVVLNEPRDIAAFLGLGAGGGAAVGAAIATAAVAAAGAVPASELLLNGLTWWLGHALGTLIGAPVVLTLAGRQREDWAPRRLSVGLPLAAVTALTAILIALVARWDDERVRAAFEREAKHAAASVAFHLQEPLHALEALRGVYVASEDVDTHELDQAARNWLAGTVRPLALGFAQRVPRAAIPDFEQAVRAEGRPGYRVFERAPAPGEPPMVPADEVYAVREVTPLVRNARALGVDALSVPAARHAIRAAVRTDRPSATAGFTLTQDGPQAPVGLVVYQALYRGTPDTAEQREAAASGVVFVALRLDETLRTAIDPLPNYLRLCIVDTDVRALHRRLFGAPGCESAEATLLHVRPLPFATRQWDVRVSADPAALPGGSRPNAWPFAVAGTLAATMLAALLLTVTGRARRIEIAVRERTAALTQEMRDRGLAEAAMRNSEQRFRNIFNTVPTGICYTDLAGTVKQANPRFCELVGYDADEIATRNFLDFTHPEDVAQDRAFAAQLVRGDVPFCRRHKRFIDRAGRTVWVQATYSLLRNEHGAPWRLLAAVEDLSEHLRLAEVERAREAAEASNRAKNEFLSRMSHELRTPLNAMLGFAQLLDMDQRHRLHESQRPWVSQMQQAGWHLLDMINDVLDLSRIESGNLRLALEPVDVGVAVRTALGGGGRGGGGRGGGVCLWGGGGGRPCVPTPRGSSRSSSTCCPTRSSTTSRAAACTSRRAPRATSSRSR